MQLKQTIGKKTLLMLVINAILGTGIFFLPAVGAAYSGPASILAWILMSFIAIVISVYFAELISMFPKSGGAYEFVKNAFGKQYGFIFGWTSWIVANITIAMLMVGSIVYLFPQADMVFKIFSSLLFILIFNFVSYRGIDIAAKMLLFFGIMTVATLAALILPGLFTVQTSNFSGIFSTPFPLIILTVYFIAETFFGWETATYLSEEIKNARKILPRILILGTVVIAVISLLLVFVALGNVDAAAFSAQEAPLAFLAEKFFGSGIGKMFSIIIFIPLIGTAASWIVSSPRLLYAMSRDRVMISRFNKVHKKYRTPSSAIAFQTVVTTVITLLALGNYIFMLSILVPLVLIMYSIVMLSVVKLRVDKPKIKRYFNAPFPKAGPVGVVIINMVLLYMWIVQVSYALQLLLMALLLIVIGFPLYIVVRLQADKKFVEKFYDRIAFLWDKFFHVWYGEKEAGKIVKYLRLKENSDVLDFGCGSGNTTLAIAEKIKSGKIVAIDLSEKQLEHAVKRIKKHGLMNVIFVKGDMKLPKNSFDAVTAVGVLEHLDRPHKYVSQLMASLKRGGRFYFLAFGKSFGIPGPEFIEDDRKIRNLFGKRDEVCIEREKKRLVEYVLIYGVKK